MSSYLEMLPGSLRSARPLAPASLLRALRSLAHSLVGRCRHTDESRVSQTDLADKNAILDRFEP